MDLAEAERRPLLWFGLIKDYYMLGTLKVLNTSNNLLLYSNKLRI